MIRVLFEQIATPGQLGALGIVEVLDWTAAALNRVERKEFRKRFQEEHTVQYFYDPFLNAFDPELRKQLGVCFTPTEIVKHEQITCNIPDSLYAALEERMNADKETCDHGVSTALSSLLRGPATFRFARDVRN